MGRMTANPNRACKEDGCEGRSFARGWCAMHYERAKQPDGTISETTFSIERKCLGCGADTRSTRHFCRDCARVIPAAERRSQYKQLHYDRNKQKYNERQKRATPAEARLYSIKSNYGVSSDELDALRAAQDNKCAVCRKPEPEGAFGHKRLHLDHDHRTGEVRGLLCMSCNTALGHLKDDPDLVRRALGYLLGTLGDLSGGVRTHESHVAHEEAI